MRKKRTGDFLFDPDGGKENKQNQEGTAEESNLIEKINEYIGDDTTVEGVDRVAHLTLASTNPDLHDEIEVAKNVARQLHFDYVDLDDFEVDMQAVALLTAEHIRRDHILPIGFEGGRLVAAMSGRTNIAAVSDLYSATGHYIVPVVVAESSLTAAIDKYAPEGIDKGLDKENAGTSKEAPRKGLKAIIGSYITGNNATEIPEAIHQEEENEPVEDAPEGGGVASDSSSEDYSGGEGQPGSQDGSVIATEEDYVDSLTAASEAYFGVASNKYVASDNANIEAVEDVEIIAAEGDSIEEDEPEDLFDVMQESDRDNVDPACVSEVDIAKNIAKQLNIDYVDLASYEINPEALAIISSEHCNRYNLLPINIENGRLIVAMSDPTNIFAIDDLHVMTGYDIVPVVVAESELGSAINKYSTTDIDIEETIGGMGKDGEHSAGLAFSEEQEAEDAPVVKLVNLIVTEAARERASDIFIEPQENDVRIRYRVDGVLQEVMRSPKHAQSGIISRIKIMAGLDIAERRVPQDGRFGLVIDKRPIDFRVATLPTIHGEQVVLRLLEKGNILLNLDDLGFLPKSLARFKESFNKPYGAILITGPTGSGKTTTLYSVLNILNVPEKNIVTVEDPVEYRLQSINQVQVNTKTGLTFASALRSILRHDPDIIMIGEIRDEETALIAIESALTGHLVFSTLHTNNSPATLTRLIEMGIEPFLVSSAVDCVVSQRLARKLCSRCKEPYEPGKEELAQAGYKIDGSEPKQLYKARGCKFCGSTGYQGRVGLYEVMIMSETIERLLVEKATIEEISKAAISEGMKTLREDGLEKVRSGLTSLDEIARVTM